MTEVPQHLLPHLLQSARWEICNAARALAHAGVPDTREELDEFDNRLDVLTKMIRTFDLLLASPDRVDPDAVTVLARSAAQDLDYRLGEDATGGDYERIKDMASAASELTNLAGAGEHAGGTPPR